jgi:streptogramin lyase
VDYTLAARRNGHGRLVHDKEVPMTARLRFATVVALATAALAAVPLVGATTAASTHRTIAACCFPADLGVGFGSVWVLDHRSGIVRRIDPRTNRIRKVTIGESLCSIPAFGAGAVWVWGCDSNTTYKIDARTDKIVKKVHGGIPVFGAGSLWLTDDSGKVLRVDPASGLVLATIPPGIEIGDDGGISAFGDDSIWVSADTGVSRIDTATNKVTDVIPLAGGKVSGEVPGGLLGGDYGVFANGKFWDTNAAGIYEIDAATNAVTHLGVVLHPLSVFGDVPIAAADGGVWVRTSDSSVARIDQQTGQLTARYPATGGGGGAVVGFGSLWVANTASGTVWRTPVH